LLVVAQKQEQRQVSGGMIYDYVLELQEVLAE
jgi:hypothetical protein